MFNFFKKKTEVEKLEALHKQLMSEAYKLSHTDRKASDFKMAEAEELMQKILALKEKTS